MRTALVIVLAMLWAPVASAQTRLPVYGGEGGGPFEQSCPPGQFLRGLELSVADDVDAARPICSVDDASIGPWRGGQGAESRRLLCPRERPAVSAVSVMAEGKKTIIVNAIHLFCSASDASARPTESSVPDARFDGPSAGGDSGIWASFNAVVPHRFSQCPPGQVGSGIHGQHGIWLDSLGLMCRTVASSAPTGKALGKRSSGPPLPPPSTPCVSIKKVWARSDRSEAQKQILLQRCLNSIPLDETSRCGRAKRAFGTPDFNRLFELCLTTVPDA